MHLISTFLFALSLAGAAQAQPSASANSPIAPAATASKTVASTAASAPKRLPAADVRALIPGSNTLLMLALGLTALGVTSRRRDLSKKFSTSLN
jgi:hypothetical protein